MTLGLTRKLTDTYWLNIADESLPFSLAVEHTNFYQQSYAGTHILYLARYVMNEDDEIWKLTGHEIYAKYVDILARKFNLQPGEVLWWKLSKAKNTSPVYRTGFLNLRLPANTPVKNLFNLGTMQSYPERSLNDAIRQSRELIATL
jgi:protoporphyrinogen oxidase